VEAADRRAVDRRNQLEFDKMNIGLVLSGGGARGIAHLGVLKFLEEKNITISHISGTSAGAIVGAFYAAGYESGRIAEIIKTVNFFSLIRPAFSSTGFFKSEKISAVYSKHLPANFEELKTPLWVSAINVEKGKTTFFQSGNLYKPILASCCLPMFFQPIEINNNLYMDGGILNNLPVEPLLTLCDKIIGVNVNSTDDHFKPKNMTKITQRCIELAISCNVGLRRKYCDLYIEPSRLKTCSMFNLTNIDDLIRYGYDEIKSLWDTVDIT